MGLFSFLFGDHGGDPNAGFAPQHQFPQPPMDPGMSVPRPHATIGVSPDVNPAMAPNLPADAGEMMQTPQIAPKEGLLARMTKPDANGTTLRDKIAMAGMMLRDNADPSQVTDYQSQIDRRQLTQQQAAHRARSNAAFKAGYQNGKWDPIAYSKSMEGDPQFDPAELEKLTQAFGPKTGVEGGYAYSLGKDGNVQWGEQRPISYAEQAQIARDADRAQHDRALEDALKARLGYESDRVGLARTREHRLSSGGGGGVAAGVPPLPPGFVVEK